MNFNEKFGIPRSIEFLKKPLVKDQIFCAWGWFPCAHCGKNTPWSCLLRDSDGLISVHVCSDECLAVFVSQGSTVVGYNEPEAGLDKTPESGEKEIVWAEPVKQPESEPIVIHSPLYSPPEPEPKPEVEKKPKTKEEAEAWLLRGPSPDGVLAWDRDLTKSAESITIVKEGKVVVAKMDDTLLKMLARRNNNV